MCVDTNTEEKVFGIVISRPWGIQYFSVPRPFRNVETSNFVIKTSIPTICYFSIVVYITSIPALLKARCMLHVWRATFSKRSKEKNIFPPFRQQ